MEGAGAIRAWPPAMEQAGLAVPPLCGQRPELPEAALWQQGICSAAAMVGDRVPLPVATLPVALPSPARPCCAGVDVNAARYVDGRRETPNGEVGEATWDMQGLRGSRPVIHAWMTIS